MNRIVLFLFLIVSLGVTAQESEKYYWEGFKYQSKLKLEKATDAYCKAFKASESKSNINSRELYYLTFAHAEIAKIYSGVSIFSNKSDNILTAYNSVKKVFEYYAILYQRNELAYIKDFERVKILTTAKESLKSIYTIKPDLFPSKDKINNDTNTTLGVELDWKNDYLAIVKKYTTLNKSIEENYLKDNDVILEITTANDYKYYSLLDFIITNRIPGDGSDGDTFRVKLVRNGQVEYTQIKKYLKQIKIEPISTKENRPANNKEDKTVTLTVSGTGKTKEDAQKNALRSAIEQAFGAFVSAKTEILNDSVIKDEIVSITSGNIQGFEVLSEGELPNGLVVSTLKTTISITKLTSFAESKGAEVEFKGAIFAMDIKLQKINEQNELKAIENLITICDALLNNSLDYSLSLKDPVIIDQKKELYQLDLIIKAKTNSNYSVFLNNFWKTIESLSMSDAEIANYKNLNKSYFQIQEIDGTTVELLRDYAERTILNLGNTYYLRNKKSLVKLFEFLKNSNRHLFDIQITGENWPIFCNYFYSNEGIDRGLDFQDTVISSHCNLIYNYIKTESMKDKYYEFSHIYSYPNSYFNYTEEMYGRQHGYSIDFFDEFIKDNNSIKRDEIGEYRQCCPHGNERFAQNSNLIKNMLEKNLMNTILMTTTPELFEYQYKVRRFLTLDEIQKISEYKIIKSN